MRLFRHPRFRLNAALSACAASLLLLGTISHRRAFRLRERALLARIEALENRPALPEPGGWGESPQIEPQPPSFPSAEGASPQSFKPRILGTGRVAGYVYADVRHSDGNWCRYYCRTNGNPTAWISRMISGEEDARISLSRQPSENTP